MKPILTVLGLNLFLFFIIGCKKESAPITPCESPEFPVKLVKTVFKSDADPNPNYFRVTRYSFDNNGRLDSIFSYGQSTFIDYKPNGQVKELRFYSIQNQVFLGRQVASYDNEGRIVAYEHYNANGTYQNTKFYNYNNQGLLSSTQYGIDNPKFFISTDDCGNLTQTLRYHEGETEPHWKWEGTYYDTFSPYYLIGLNSVFPDEYTIHNPRTDFVVFWDCTFDYFSTDEPIIYTYNEYGLPETSKSYLGTITYFYE